MVLSGLSQNDRTLLKIVLDDNRTQEDIDLFFKEWDIETAPIKTILPIAYTWHTCPDLSFPDTVIPRLNGVLSYCRFKNLRTESDFDKISSSLNSKQIQYIITGDWAMRKLRPEYPRWIDFVDIIILTSDYSAAIEATSSIKDNKVYIHETEDKDLFGYSSESLPCPEYLVYSFLLNIHNLLFSGQPVVECIYKLLDIKYLSSINNLKLDTILDYARANNKEYQTLIASEIVNSFIPGLFPENWLESNSISKRLLKKRRVNFLFHRDVVKRFKMKKGTRRIPIPSFIKYLTWLLVSKLGL